MPEPFKNFINRAAIERLGALLAAPDFAEEAFVEQASAGIADLELKDRVRWVAKVLQEHLPGDPPAQYQRLLDCLPTPVDGPEEGSVEDAFYLWPFLQVVENTGVHHPEEALDALYVMTRFFSAEFAIRPLLREHPDLVFQRLQVWVHDPNVHVRRLVSEGTRPLLPWGERLRGLKADPGPAIPLLHALYQDDERYVQRSVANHVNDISKTHPQIALELCRQWSDQDWVVRHALRGLIKKGDVGALEVLGFEAPRVQVEGPHLSTGTISVGQTMTLSIILRSTIDGPQRLLIDYALHYQKKNGTTSPKVFKWTTLTLTPGEERTLTRKVSMRRVTTRTLYPGLHHVEVMINGCSQGQVSFTLGVDEV